MPLKKYFASFLLLSIFICHSFYGISQRNAYEDLFKDRKELYFQFNHPGTKVLVELNKVISIDNVAADKVYAYANTTQFNKFVEYKLSYEVLTAPSLLFPAFMKDEINLKEVNDWDFYPTYEAYLELMNQFVEDYPELCTLVTIGQSIEDRDILALIISDNIGTAEGEPQFLYTSSIHGDELTGYVLTLRLIDYLLSNYGSDDEVDELVNNLEIWINPLANPDGTYAGGNSSVNGAIRYNSNGVDLNRNYPDPEDGPNPDGNEWQQETILFMELAENNNFVMSANFHGGTEVCNYPWDTWAKLHADNDWWYYVCRQYADTVHENAPNGYMSGYDNGITNGYAWYTISGGRQDYMNYFHQCREFTLEISDTKLIPAFQLPDHWDYNYRSMLNYMKQALYGVSGSVTDAETGNPLKAEVFIYGHDEDSSWVYSDELFGKYYRFLYEGSYDITFTATGYYSQTIEDVTVFNESLTQLDVELESGDLIVDFESDETQIPVGSVVDFVDLTYGSPVSWEWTFEGGYPANSSEQHPEDIWYGDEGMFDVSLTVSDGSNTMTVTKENYISVSLDFIIENTTVTTCSGLFYDSGGADDNYNDSEDFIMTFLPAVSGSKLSIDFLMFDVEYDDNCDYDWLKIYDGTDLNAPLIGKYCGSNSPGEITASSDDGALTFEFHSDNSVTGQGWIASVNCDNVTLVPIADFIADANLIEVGQAVNFSDQSLNDPESWEWTFEGGSPETSSYESPSVVYNTAGVFDVTLTVSNSAGSNTITKTDYITVDQASAIDDRAKPSLKIFPNPVSELLQIESNSIIKSLQIFSLSGEEYINIQPMSNSVQQSIAHLPNGLYLLTICTDDETYRRKLEVVK